MQTHTPATEGKDKWAGASAEQGQKQESRLGGPGPGPGALARGLHRAVPRSPLLIIVSGREAVSLFFLWPRVR